MLLRYRTHLTAMLLLLALLVTMPLLSSCGGPEPTTPSTPAPAPAPAAVVEFDVVKAAVADYLVGPSGNMKPEDLQIKIAENNSPYIVSIRSAEDYAAGHIPGAMNMKFGELSTVPMDQDIVVYCYTGQSASFGTAVLGIQGYSVMNLRHGMSSWSDDSEVYKKRYSGAAGYDTETTPNIGGSYAMPTLENTSSNDDAAIIAAAAATVSPKYISAKDLQVKISEGEAMTILSVRKADAYAVGHIPGAINAPYGPNIVSALSQLDPDAPVYVYCYTGHTAAQSTAMLQMLGYDAYSVSFGMCGWSDNPDVTKGACFTPEMSKGYDIEK
ncbi:rhodanese-like domain-containing protein [Chloroflexota bacterium]